jgi:hypothetical protein
MIDTSYSCCAVTFHSQRGLRCSRYVAARPPLWGYARRMAVGSCTKGDEGGPFCLSLAGSTSTSQQKRPHDIPGGDPKRAAVLRRPAGCYLATPDTKGLSEYQPHEETATQIGPKVVLLPTQQLRADPSSVCRVTQLGSAHGSWRVSRETLKYCGRAIYTLAIRHSA